MAAALLGGSGLGLGLDDFTDALAVDSQRRELMAKVDVVGDDALLEIYPYQFPAVLEVTTTDGHVLREERLSNRGGDVHPLSADDLATKFTDNARGRIDDVTRERIIDSVGRLSELDSLAPLMEGL